MKRIFKQWWIVLGAIIIVWTLFWFIFVRILNHYAFIINVMLLVIGYCLLINYALITIVYWAVKRMQIKWEIK
jgi:hypothetical protein